MHHFSRYYTRFFPVPSDTQEHANRAAQAVKATYQTTGPPIITIADAIKQESFFPDPPPLKVGDAQGQSSAVTLLTLWTGPCTDIRT